MKSHPPNYYAAWQRLLMRARQDGDLDAALALRRQDAAEHGFDPTPALNEERAWWDKHMAVTKR